MQTFDREAWLVATSSLGVLTPRHCTTRYAIRTDKGFLAACTGIGGIPVREVSDPLEAVRFADYETAALRARALIKLGWDELRIVTLVMPLFH